MGTRTGKEPDASQTFLWRICHALDITPQEMAKAIDVEYVQDLKPLLFQKGEIERDEVWWLISEYISLRMGYLMAVKQELNRTLQRDRAARVARVNRMRHVITNRD